MMTPNAKSFEKRKGSRPVRRALPSASAIHGVVRTIPPGSGSFASFEEQSRRQHTASCSMSLCIAQSIDTTN